jgi:hypothetical protein
MLPVPSLALRPSISDDELRALVAFLRQMLHRARRELKHMPSSPWVAEGEEAVERLILRVTQHQHTPFAAFCRGQDLERGAGLSACRETWSRLLPQLRRDISTIDRLTDGTL